MKKYRELKESDTASAPSRIDRILGVGIGMTEWDKAKRQLRQERKVTWESAKSK